MNETLLMTAAPGDDGEMRRSQAGAHEQDHVFMPGLSVVHQLLLEELEMLLVVAVDLHQADGHLAVPAALVHFPPAALQSDRRLCVLHVFCFHPVSVCS